MASRLLSFLQRVIAGASPDDLRAPVGGLLFLLGGVLGGISLLLPHPPSGLPFQLAICVSSTLVGLWWLIAGSRIPSLVIYLGEAGASAMISAAVVASGVSDGIYPTMYLWIALYSGYFFRPRMALAQLAWLLLTYGVALSLVGIGGDEYSAFTRWIFTAMTLSVATGMGSLLVAQRRRVEAERAGLAVQREQLLESAKSEARTDALTGILNRRGLVEDLEREIARAERMKLSLCLAVIDLDNFKRFNDAFGHIEGDELLTESVAAWSEELRRGDRLARLGGEEFVVILPATSLEAAAFVIERLRAATPRDQTCSAGVIRLWLSEPVEDALRRADEAMYRAKGAGRNRTVVDDEPSPLAST